MNPRDKKYILENIDKKTAAVIARELNLKERTVNRFLKFHYGQIRKDLPKEEKAAPPLNKKIIFISLILIIIFGSVSYVNSLRNPFIWDDDSLIVNNPVIRDPGNIPLLFQRDVFHQGDIAGRASGKSNFYRPLQMLLFTVDYAIGKLSVIPYHISNIIFHILTALMLYWLAYLIFENAIVPLVASILFITHPIHTEAVVYISGIADPMSAFFMLSGMVFYIKYCRSENRPYFYILSLLSFLAALLSKEIAVIFPVLLIGYDGIYKGGRGLSIKKLGPFLALAAVYILFRMTIFNFPVKRIPEITTFIQRLPAVFQSLFSYLAILLLPLNLHMEYQTVLSSIADPRVAAGAVIAILLIWAIIISAKKAKAVSFALTWFLIIYLPISNIFPLNASFAEHWIYTPSLGLFMLVGWVIFNIYERKHFLKTFILCVVVAWTCINCYLTIKQNRTWSDAEGFYERNLRFNPTSERIHSNLGAIYDSKGKYEQAISELTRAIELNPKLAETYINRSAAYNNIGNYDQAILDCARAIELSPSQAQAYNNRGVSYTHKGNYDQAVLDFTRAIELKANYARAYNNRAFVYYSKNEFDKARDDAHRAELLGYKVNSQFLGALKKASTPN